MGTVTSSTGHETDTPLPPPPELVIGLDVGSTTVKAVVVDPRTDAILWKDYQRHETRQPAKVLEFLERIESAYPLSNHSFQTFVTGSGGAAIAAQIGGRFVQEVNAVALAVERYYPEAGSVIELGGQDAKIVIWVEDLTTGQRRKLPSMNDKCAGGTGAVVDKITAKLGLPIAALGSLRYEGVKLHPVAGKCGVFAETDINGLQKQGVPAEELMASLFEAIVQQNLSVLTRGNTLRPQVLLLGGPNTFIPALQAAWRAHIPQIWAERGTPLPAGVAPADLVIVPKDAEYFAAVGAVLFGKGEDAAIGRYAGSSALAAYVAGGISQLRESMGAPGLVASAEELEAFTATYRIPEFTPIHASPGEVIEAYVGIDGGSTSTKAVLMDATGELLARSYQLSRGNPIEDTREILADLRDQIERQGATLHVRGVGTTGYAKDMLKETIGADVAIVETVAHTQSTLHYYRDVDVIVDVGGQDIKVIMLHEGKVKDFRLNTQCSAGNGYFLQATAARFGYAVNEYADAAFQAKRIPTFNYGCAVFMESDIVNFQQLGWTREEVMGGLAAVLPKNIWLYVVQEPNLGKLGRRFVLQGGTQHNLAAVKAQVDFIRQRVPDAEVIVHRFCGESGAIGAALEAIRVVGDGESTFIGLAAVNAIEYSATRSEEGRCYFCKNRCLRTFIDTRTPDGGKRRFIIATCEKGTVEDLDDMRVIKAKLDAVRDANPNFVEIAARQAFRSPPTEPVAAAEPPRMARWLPGHRRRWHEERVRWNERRARTIVGIPRVLSMYSCAPFFSAYLQGLGIPRRQIVLSPETDEALWKNGSRRGAIDQCFPSKVALAHVHWLLYESKQRPNLIFFPAMASLPTELSHVVDSCTCPTVAATPSVVRAAFTREEDVFADHNCAYETPVLHMAEPTLVAQQLLEWAGPLLGVTPEENAEAMVQGYAALRDFRDSLRGQASDVLAQLERERRVGVVLLGRPYHNDLGLNHEIAEAIQRLGFPIFSIDSLPSTPEMLNRLFGEEVATGVIQSPMDVTDVWKNAYSENSNRKVWAAKYVARHPNLVALDLSSFKCGHDAPIGSVIEGIIESSGTPYFTFYDVDENNPAGSIKLRVETIGYFLRRYEDELRERAELEQRVTAATNAYAQALRAGTAVTREVFALPQQRRSLVPLGLSLVSRATPSAHDACGPSGAPCSGGCDSAPPVELIPVQDLLRVIHAPRQPHEVGEPR